MADYLSMDVAALQTELQHLKGAYDTFAARGLKLDMSRGKPAPQQLELSMDLLRMDDYLDESGMDTRNYGGLEGCAEARAYFAQLMGVEMDETIVAGPASLNIMYNMIEMGWRKGFVPGNPLQNAGPVKFLCPTPGYDRHFRITEDFGFELLSVPMTPNGPDMDVVEKLVADPAVKGIWCIPVYSNPDGYVYSAETVQRLAEMEVAAHDFRIFWDNAYFLHHLTEEICDCPNLLEACRAAGNEDRALMFCSTSKITFASAGVSAMAASKGNIKQALAFMFPMIISHDKVNQLRHVRFLKRVGIAAHMQKHAALLAPKFHMVVQTLRDNLGGCGDIARWTEPKGGYFISLYVMQGCAKQVVTLCKQAGVTLTDAGAAYPYGVDPEDIHIRIAPSFPSGEELAAAAELLCVVVRLVAVEKLLAARL